MEMVYARPQKIWNFVDSVAEKDLTWFTTGQCANYSTGSHEPLLMISVM